jgi:hypothetical protein
MSSFEDERSLGQEFRDLRLTYQARSLEIRAEHIKPWPLLVSDLKPNQNQTSCLPLFPFFLNSKNRLKDLLRSQSPFRFSIFFDRVDNWARGQTPPKVCS